MIEKRLNYLLVAFFFLVVAVGVSRIELPSHVHAQGAGPITFTATGGTAGPGGCGAVSAATAATYCFASNGLFQSIGGGAYVQITVSSAAPPTVTINGQTSKTNSFTITTAAPQVTSAAPVVSAAAPAVSVVGN